MSARDIDVVIIYRDGLPLNCIREYRDKLSALIEMRLGLKVDFCTLSEDEARTNSFLNDEAVVMLDLEA